MSEADDLLFAPIAPEKASKPDVLVEKATTPNQIHLRNLVPAHIQVNLGGAIMKIGDTKGYFKFPQGDILLVNSKRYVVVVSGDYDNCIVELVP